MSSFTFADNRLGGRLTAAADAIGSGKLRTAAGIFMEVANELYAEAESTDGLLSSAEPDPVKAAESVGDQEARQMMTTKPPAPSLTVQQHTDTSSCAKGAHSFPQSPDHNGWFTCLACGYVVVTPPSSGPYDMGSRQ